MSRTCTWVKVNIMPDVELQAVEKRKEVEKRVDELQMEVHAATGDKEELQRVAHRCEQLEVSAGPQLTMYWSHSILC